MSNQQSVTKYASEVLNGERLFRENAQHLLIKEAHADDVFTTLVCHTPDNRRIVKSYWSDDLINVLTDDKEQQAS